MVGLTPLIHALAERAVNLDTFLPPGSQSFYFPSSSVAVRQHFLPGHERPLKYTGPGPFPAITGSLRGRNKVLSRIFRFGEFALDMDRYQLQRRGFDVRLENLPLRLLMLLLNRRGQIVSRREIEEELWGRDVFVDVEQGINTAIRKIRQVLRDHPEKPRYLQTVVGKGYRFIAVEVVEEETAGPSAAISKTGNGGVAVTLEQLGQAILSAAGLDGVPPNRLRPEFFARGERSDDPENLRPVQVGPDSQQG